MFIFQLKDGKGAAKPTDGAGNDSNAWISSDEDIKNVQGIPIPL